MLTRAVLLAAAATIASCFGAPTVPPAVTKCDMQTVSMNIVASATINPTLEGEARPVQMRIYQLKDDVRLQSADFEAVWKDDVKALATDIIKRDELFVYPATRTDLKFDRDPNALHVVGVALFRNPKGRSWYVSFDLPPPPGKGDCRVPGCEGPDCGLNPNPKFAVWVDQTRVDDGGGHLDDVSDGRRIRVIQLTKPLAAPTAATTEAK